MNAWRFVRRSLTHHWRINLAVALGVTAATAVLTGALLVGDSVRHSLRQLTLERLGAIDEILVTDRYFREQLADELAAQRGFAESFGKVVPAIVVPSATVEPQDSDNIARSSSVLVVGCDEEFWRLGTSGVRPTPLPEGDQIVLNRPLAEDLGVDVGDRVVIRLAKVNQVPADSPLGRKTERIRSLAQLTVVDIIPAEGLGRFSLAASQNLPYNAYVAKQTLQEALDQDARVNALLVGSGPADEPTSPEASAALAEMLQPKFGDYGFRIQPIRLTYQPPGSDGARTALAYYSFTSEAMVIDPVAADAALAAFESLNAQPVLTYLATGIARVSASDDASPSIPYSTITAVDSVAGLGPLLDDGGDPIMLGDDEIALNSWAAEDLQVEVGDRLRVTYFEPETTHALPVERSSVFRLKAIVPLTEPARGYSRRRPAEYDEPPTPANDSDLTPEVEGVTDQQSISDWEAPFPVDYDRIRPQDDDYWQLYRTTPKAFVSLATGQRLWGSRFGSLTSIRIPREAVEQPDDEGAIERLQEAFVAQIAPRDASLGFAFIPVKRQGLEGARGTTPFDALFLGLSFFIIAAAVLLVALLFRLGIQQRSAEIGTLLAAGVSARRVARLLTCEGAIVALLGGAVGLAVGIGYAWLMLTGLRTWWLGAISSPFLNLKIGQLSLVLGYVSGVLICVLTIAWSMRQVKRFSVRSLLGGQAWGGSQLVSQRGGRATMVAVGLLVAAGALAVLATGQLSGEAQAGAFVGSGAAALSALLILLWVFLRTGGGRAARVGGGAALAKFAARNAGRNPGRSTMTVGLMASASFLIIALSAFRLAPTEEGTGGFELVAQSSEPVFENLNSESGRQALLADQASTLDGATVIPLRLKPGEDASCRNLYKTSRPRLLGITPAMVAHFDTTEGPHFRWAASAAETPEEQANPWQLLANARARDAEAVPVVIDKNTAMYSLHLYGGIGETFQVDFEDNVQVTFRVAGLLANSILQGSLLVSEQDLLEHFPDISGYRYFLLQPPPIADAEVHAAQRDGPLAGLPAEQIRRRLRTEASQQMASVLEDRLSDQGFDAVSARELLAELLAVQNTYLSTFQSLGALGLLLGTFGLATVQLRSVLERRGELGLLRAAGFRRRRLAGLVMLENTLLLLAGLATGVLAALLAVLPHMLIGGAAVPWRDLALLLGIILAVGFVSGFAAVRATLRAPLLGALRGQ